MEINKEETFYIQWINQLLQPTYQIHQLQTDLTPLIFQLLIEKIIYVK